MTLKKHFESVFGMLAMLLALIMAQAAAYNLGGRIGDTLVPLLSLILTGYAIQYAMRQPGNVLPSIVAMTVSFGLLSVFLSFSWYLRRMLFDLNTNYFLTGERDSLILYVVLPHMMLAILAPVLIRRAGQLSRDKG
ncbi:hypothetical protein [Ponticaulis profundi]|uniref:Rod shape-determining protein MreD n=1 Tax=Ponticaulis profundi TaxID=2665222 RepID=A0ABW1S8U6_9PROT